jgi:hypothetical protein
MTTNQISYNPPNQNANRISEQTEVKLYINLKAEADRFYCFIVQAVLNLLF